MQGGVGVVYLHVVLVLWVCTGLDKVEVSLISDSIDDHSDNVSFRIQPLLTDSTKVLPGSLQARK